MREYKDDAQAGNQTANHGPGESEQQLVHGLTEAGEGDKKTRDNGGTHPGPGDERVDGVRNHDRHRGLQGKLPMCGIAERVGGEKSPGRALRTPITAGYGSPLAPTSCAGGGGGSCVAAAAPDSMTCLQARNRRASSS